MALQQIEWVDNSPSRSEATTTGATWNKRRRNNTEFVRYMRPEIVVNLRDHHSRVTKCHSMDALEREAGVNCATATRGRVHLSIDLIITLIGRRV